MISVYDHDYRQILKEIINNPGIVGTKILGIRIGMIGIKVKIFEDEGLINRYKLSGSNSKHCYITKEGLDKYISLLHLEDDLLDKNSTEIEEVTLEGLYRLHPDDRQQIINDRIEWLRVVRAEERRMLKKETSRYYNFKRKHEELKKNGRTEE